MYIVRNNIRMHHPNYWQTHTNLFSITNNHLLMVWISFWLKAQNLWHFINWEIHQLLQMVRSPVVLSSGVASQKGHDPSWVGHAWIDKPLDDLFAILNWGGPGSSFSRPCRLFGGPRTVQATVPDVAFALVGYVCLWSTTPLEFVRMPF